MDHIFVSVLKMNNSTSMNGLSWVITHPWHNHGSVVCPSNLQQNKYNICMWMFSLVRYTNLIASFQARQKISESMRNHNPNLSKLCSKHVQNHESKLLLELWLFYVEIGWVLAVPFDMCKFFDTPGSSQLNCWTGSSCGIERKNTSTLP